MQCLLRGYLGGSTGWIKIDLGTAQTVTAYTLWSASTNQSPSAWTLEGSNTGAFSGEQKILDQRTGIANWGADSSYVITQPSGCL